MTTQRMRNKVLKGLKSIGVKCERLDPDSVGIEDKYLAMVFIKGDLERYRDNTYHFQERVYITRKMVIEFMEKYKNVLNKNMLEELQEIVDEIEDVGCNVVDELFHYTS